MLKPDPIDDQPLDGDKTCCRPRCQSWKMITHSQTAATSCGARVKLKGDTNCRTQNVSSVPLNIRTNGHRDDWRHKRYERSPVGERFCLSGHASDCCLESNPEGTDNARKSRESYWIRRLLNTLNPRGINKGD